MKSNHFRISFISSDREPRLSRLQSVEDDNDEVAAETEEIDVNDAEGGDFDKEGDAEEEDIEFWGGMEDLDSMVRVGREEAGEDREMWADLESVRNSEVIEAVPIVRDSELSINDSVSPIVYQ